MHFGQVTQPGAGMDTAKETGTFMVDRKKGGVGLTMPKNGTGGHLTFSALHSNFTGGVPFAWTDGTPTATSVGAGTQYDRQHDLPWPISLVCVALTMLRMCACLALFRYCSSKACHGCGSLYSPTVTCSMSGHSSSTDR